MKPEIRRILERCRDALEGDNRQGQLEHDINRVLLRDRYPGPVSPTLYRDEMPECDGSGDCAWCRDEQAEPVGPCPMPVRP